MPFTISGHSARSRPHTCTTWITTDGWPSKRQRNVVPPCKRSSTCRLPNRPPSSAKPTLPHSNSLITTWHLSLARGKFQRKRQTNYGRIKAMQQKASGWTAERRARQATLIQNWRPWDTSTGPRTAEGKARSSGNAWQHGGRSQEARAELAALRRMLCEIDAMNRNILQRRYG